MTIGAALFAEALRPELGRIVIDFGVPADINRNRFFVNLSNLARDACTYICIENTGNITGVPFVMTTGLAPSNWAGNSMSRVHTR